MPFPNTVTASPGGITNCSPQQTLAAFGGCDPTWGSVYANDFHTYLASDFAFTRVGSGTTALTPFDGGALLSTNTAGATDATIQQLAVASFKWAPNHELFFKWSGQLSEVTNNTFYVGFMTTSATPLTGADGVYLLKASGAATFSLVTVIGGVTTTTPLPTTLTPVANTTFELGIHIDPQGNVEAFFNPTTGNTRTDKSALQQYPKGSVVKVLATSTTSITQALLNPTVGFVNTSAASRTVLTDFLVAVKD